MKIQAACYHLMWLHHYSETANVIAHMATYHNPNPTASQAFAVPTPNHARVTLQRSHDYHVTVSE